MNGMREQEKDGWVIHKLLFFPFISLRFGGQSIKLFVNHLTRS